MGGRRPHHGGSDEAVLRGYAGSRRAPGGSASCGADRALEIQGLGCAVLLGSVHPRRRVAVKANGGDRMANTLLPVPDKIDAGSRTAADSWMRTGSPEDASA